jgi:hypothetical protein
LLFLEHFILAAFGLTDPDSSGLNVNVIDLYCMDEKVSTTMIRDFIEILNTAAARQGFALPPFNNVYRSEWNGITSIILPDAQVSFSPPGIREIFVGKRRDGVYQQCNTKNLDRYLDLATSLNYVDDEITAEIAALVNALPPRPMMESTVRRVKYPIYVTSDRDPVRSYYRVIEIVTACAAEYNGGRRTR